MANLYFKVNADYQELIRMRIEANRLKDEMENFSGTSDEFRRLAEQWRDMNSQIRSLANDTLCDAVDAMKSLAENAGLVVGKVKDIGTFEQSINNMTSAAEGMAYILARAFDSQSLQDVDMVLENTKKNYDILSESIERLRAEMAQSNDPNAVAQYEVLVGTLEQAASKYEHLGKEAEYVRKVVADAVDPVQKFTSPQVDTSNVDSLLSGIKFCSDAIKDANQNLSVFKEKQDEMQESGNGDMFLKYNDAIREQEQIIRDATKAMQDYQQTLATPPEGNITNVATPNEYYNKSQRKERDKLNEKADKLAEEINNTPIDTKKYEELSLKLQDVNGKLADLKVKAINAASGLGDNLGKRASDADKKMTSLSSSIKRQEEHLKTLKDKLKETEEALAAESLKANANKDTLDALEQRHISLIAAVENSNNKLAESKGKFADAQKEMANMDGEVERHNSIMVKMLGGQEKFNAVVSKLPQPLQNAVSGLQGMTGAAKAFIATPLGAVLAAITLAVQAMSMWFQNSVEGQQAFAKVSGYVTGVLNVLKGVVIKVGKALYTAFTDPIDAAKKLWNAIKTNIVNRIKSIGEIASDLGDILKAAFTFDTDGVKKAFQNMMNHFLKFGTGVDNVTGKVKNFVNEMHEAGKAESDLSEREFKNRQLIGDLTDKMAELQDITAGKRKASAAEKAAAKQQVKALQAQMKTAKQEQVNILEERKKLRGENWSTRDEDELHRAKREMYNTDRRFNRMANMMTPKAQHHQNDDWSVREKELENDIKEAEEMRKFLLEDENRTAQERIKLMADGAEKVRKQQQLDTKMELEAIDERYRQRMMKIIANEKKEFDAQESARLKKNKGYKRRHYYESEQYRSHFDENGEMVVDKAYKPAMDRDLELAELKRRQEESKTLQENLKQFEQFYDKRLAIELNYQRQVEKYRDLYRAGAIDDAGLSNVEQQLAQQKLADMQRLTLEEFKDSPLYSSAMMGDLVNYSELEKARKEMQRLGQIAAETMNPADFKAFADVYNQLSESMIEVNPFGAIKDSVEELHKAELGLTAAQKELNLVYMKFGVDGSGREQAGGEMAALHAAQTQARLEYEDAMAQQASLGDNATSEQVQEAADKVAESYKKLTEATLAYKNAKDEVARVENRVQNQETRVNQSQKKLTKSTKQAATTARQWGKALADAAGMFSQPVADAINGVSNLVSTSIESIGTLKKASDASAKGIAKVADAVQKGIAILAIIQAAWQVINTIMSLFGGKAEEEYKKRIDGLQSQIDALDFSFNALKEDMDNAWGTEAIDAYIKAVETLNDRQKAQLELIKEQSKAHIGHHSLEHYMKKEAGITDKELAEAKKRIEELGGDTSTGWITDWIYTLTADQLKQFLTEGIGVTITGKLGGVSGTGDYSGDEWLNDLQEFANSAQTAEDMADEMAAKLNGISLDGLKDEIKSLVTTFDTSFNDINNSFDEFMREAAYNKARTKYDKDLEQFYSDLSEINDLYTEGEISEEEYRKRIAEMRERYKSLVKGAQDDYQQSLTDAGVNVKDVEQGATTGGFEAMSEDTGTELNGRFAAMQAQETITAENTGKILTFTGAIHDIADEIRDVQVASLLELRGINENTKKVVEPILAMQEDIKRIKENTESL